MCGRSSLYMGGCWGLWVVVSVHGWLLPCMGGCFHVWVVVSMHRQLFLNVGDCLHSWVLVFICGWSFLYVGSRFWMWVISFVHKWSLALVGSLLHMGSLSCVSAGTIFGRTGLPCFTRKNDDKQWILIHHSSFSCHITDSNVALCALLALYGCWWLLWLCGACIGGCSVWWWMVSAGNSRQCVWMCRWWVVVTWKVVGWRFGQNSHLQNLPASLLGRWLWIGI